MSELGPESRALFASARRDLAITAEERARMDHALAAKLGLATGAAALAAKGAAASLPPAGKVGVATAAPSAVPLAVKIAGALALASAVGGGAAFYAFHRAAPAPAVAASNAVTTSHPSPSLESQALPVPTSSSASALALETNVVAAPPASPVSAVPIRRPSAPIAPSPSASAPKVSEGRVAAETQLLRDADAALRSGDAVQALALLDDHARTYPNGVLREECSAERIFALCKLGRVSEARGETERFLRDSGESPLAASVRSSCGGPGTAP
ncbi:hypothetical protein AKJ09_11253 [Labilithrix luteola]|uniref:Uncharacterized protein n=1 Tax=Labilithrix luteola TaxID=1391654 RepID=A0A0K1QGM8_9BACT|nr:hypothetical protein [Labilithrix luteola]AKV04590.1 hypothetical protein AKJ09_11253 [Labilithrix luteola]